VSENPQKAQEDFYRFPYHYIANLPPNFGISKLDGWHLNYVSAVVFLLQKISLERHQATIVDIGCGDGRFTHELVKRFPGAKVKGVDYSQKAISLAKAMNLGAKATFEARDLLHDPVEFGADIAVLMEVYEHIDPSDAKRFLSGVRDTLRPGGVLHLTVPHRNCPISPHHFRHFDSETLCQEISDFFEVTDVKPFERISPLRRWLYRLLANRYFVLNHQPTLNLIFNWYMKKLFECDDEGECQRLYLRAVRQ
jgi:2-polyprenyl-3-methyl-5-hydroxy-6-metoxy-1,4-benzoquinol methylase